MRLYREAMSGLQLYWHTLSLYCCWAPQNLMCLVPLHAHVLHTLNPDEPIPKHTCTSGMHANEQTPEQQHSAPSTPQSPTPRSARLRGRANRPTPLAPSASKAAQQYADATNEVCTSVAPTGLCKVLHSSRVVLPIICGRQTVLISVLMVQHKCKKALHELHFPLTTFVDSDMQVLVECSCM